jgi:Na+:H+ antiporter, NhaA family
MNSSARKKKRIGLSLSALMQSGVFGGILLILFTLIALIWANSPWKSFYLELWETPLGFEIGTFHFEMHLLHWINDVLMAVFFYVVGLEIKREIIAGELSSAKKATLPALGALGGMLLPALIYTLIIILGKRPDAASGWGVPMATDIAFSLGIISLLGKRVPLALKVFLVALAIVDDLGAIVVIALFYSAQLNFTYLFLGFAIIGILVLLNQLNFRYIGIYHLLGLFIWICFYKAGIHATISGVVLAFTIPISRELDIPTFRKQINDLQMKEHGHTRHTLAHHQIDDIQYIKKQIKKLESPVQRLEHGLSSTVNYLIMPLFALANAGVTLGGNGTKAFSLITVAVAIALFIGKSFGITLMAWIGCKIGLSELPDKAKWRELFAVAILGGLGFTMAIFVANLAFTDVALLGQAKVGILIGSLVSGIVGYLVLMKMYPDPNDKKISTK